MTKRTAPLGGGAMGEKKTRGGAFLNSHSTPVRPELLPVGGGCFARICGNVLTRRCSSRQFLHKPQAICYLRASLEQAERAGITLLEVEAPDRGQVYRASLAKFWAKAFPLNRGHGEQLGLDLGEWETEDGGPEPPEPPQMPAVNAAEPEDMAWAVPLPLFGWLAL